MLLYCSLGNGIEFSCTDEHAKNLTQRIRQQQEMKMDSNELNEIEFKNANRSVNAAELNNETNFIIQMPGTTTKQ